MEKDKGSGFVLGLLIGSMVGAAIAVLMTPATGEETRRLLKERAYEPARAKVIDLAEDMRTKAEDLAADLKIKANDIATDLKSRANEIWEKSKKTVSEKKDDLFETFGKNNQERKRIS